MIEFKNPKELFNSVPYGFSQVSIAKGARIVSLSGQVGWTAEQELVGRGDIYAETCKALENVQTALASGGATLADIASMRIYIVDYKRAESPEISRALHKFFPQGQAPTATWVGVSALANPDFRIEIEVMAVVED